jgi:hypothetical protein
MGTKFAVFKVPRQCPLVLLAWERLVYWIRSILILKKLDRLQWGKMQSDIGRATLGGNFKK